jgi:hypothetical protein
VFDLAKAQRLFKNLRTFTSDSSRQLDILRHDGDSLGVDGAQVGVFEQANQVRFGRFLQRQDRGGLESQVSLEILGDFSDQSLERQLSDEQFRGLLVLADFSQRDGTRAVSVRLLDATSRRRGFARGLGRELLSRGFATGGFTGSLFGTSHCDLNNEEMKSCLNESFFEKSRIRVEIEIYNLEDIGCINDSYDLKLRNEIEI